MYLTCLYIYFTPVHYYMHLPFNLFIIYLSFICVFSIGLSVYPSINLSVYLSIHPLIHVAVVQNCGIIFMNLTGQLQVKHVRWVSGDITAIIHSFLPLSSLSLSLSLFSVYLLSIYLSIYSLSFDLSIYLSICLFKYIFYIPHPITIYIYNILSKHFRDEYSSAGRTLCSCKYRYTS